MTSTRTRRPWCSAPGTCSGWPRCAARSASGPGPSTSPSRWPASRIRVEIDAASFRTGNPARDASVRSARFLDAGRHPVMVFVAEEMDGDVLNGTLTVCGTTRPVRLPAEVERASGRLVHGPRRGADRPDRVRGHRVPRAGRALPRRVRRGPVRAPWLTRSRSRGLARATARCRPCAGSASRSAAARSSRCSGRTARGRRPRWRSWKGSAARDGGQADVLGLRSRRPGHRPGAARADRAGAAGHRGRALPDGPRDARPQRAATTRRRGTSTR